MNPSLRALVFMVGMLLLLSALPVFAFQGTPSEGRLIESLLKKKDYLQALVELKKVYAVHPYDEETETLIGMTYTHAGRMLVNQARYEEADELLRDAQDFDDEEPSYWMLRGVALYRMNELVDAEWQLNRARHMGDGAPEPVVLKVLADIFYQSGRFWEAIDALEELLHLDPENPHLQAQLEKVRRESLVEQNQDKEYGGHFVISFDGAENPGLGRQVLDVLENAYNWIGQQLSYYPDVQVQVILYSREQYRDLTGAPEWSGGKFDGKVRLPVGGLRSLTQDVKATLYHEYMHVVLHDIAGEHLPYWLNEGLAEVAERQVASRSLIYLERARAAERLFAFRDLESSFSRFTPHQVAIAYEQSYAFVAYLLAEYNWYKVRDIIFALAEGLSIGQAIERCLGDFGVDYTLLERRWKMTL